MKRKYEIAFAYPTSPNAERLGFKETGCYYIMETVMRDDRSVGVGIAPGCEGFADRDDPDLLALLKEYRA